MKTTSLLDVGKTLTNDVDTTFICNVFSTLFRRRSMTSKQRRYSTSAKLRQMTSIQLSYATYVRRRYMTPKQRRYSTLTKRGDYESCIDVGTDVETTSLQRHFARWVYASISTILHNQRICSDHFLNLSLYLYNGLTNVPRKMC